MDRDTALGTLGLEEARIVSLSQDDSTAMNEVPSCPGWTLTQVVDHLANVYGWAALVLGTATGERPDRAAVPARPAARSIGGFLHERFEVLRSLFDTVPDAAPRWNFVARGPAAASFWWRRQLYETVIHRVDVELASDQEVSLLAPELAAGGVTEFLELARYTAVDWSELAIGDGLAVHMHATDADEGAEWTVDVANGQFAHAHMKGDVALRGPAWSLYRWLWGRGAIDDIEVLGSRQAAGDWRPHL